MKKKIQFSALCFGCGEFCKEKICFGFWKREVEDQYRRERGKLGPNPFFNICWQPQYNEEQCQWDVPNIYIQVFDENICICTTMYAGRKM